MSMSTHCIGFKPADEKWERMKAVWDACTEAGIAIPNEVEEFFDYKSPDSAGVEVEEKKLCECSALKKWEGDYSEGFEIDVLKLPKDITIIRFYNSW